MTPEQLTILTALVGLLKVWPVWAGLIVVCVISPWVAIIMLVRMIERNQETRFNAMVATSKQQFDDVVRTMQRQFEETLAMYKNNVKLVEFAEQISADYKELALMVNTALTTLTELIRNNLYCPVMSHKVKIGMDVRREN
jgi:hypothetical protein